jgi:hypothetical protein
MNPNKAFVVPLGILQTPATETLLGKCSLTQDRLA